MGGRGVDGVVSSLQMNGHQTPESCPAIGLKENNLQISDIFY
jgi:hypothetical protein